MTLFNFLIVYCLSFDSFYGENQAFLDILPKPLAGIKLQSLLQEQQAKTLLTAERGHMVQPSLLKALSKAYGLPYLLLGIIKLVNDILNFAGPLLLNVLIRYLETPSEPFDLDPHKAAKGDHQRPWWLPQPDTLAFGLCCAGLLGITSLIKVCVHLTCLFQHVTTQIPESLQDC